MSRYDGLIIPRSYSEYINKTDAATLSQALALVSSISGNKTFLGKTTFNGGLNYDNKDISIVGGVMRCFNGAWQLITENHQALNVESIEQHDNVIKVNFKNGYRNPIGFYCGFDEDFTRLGFSCGASVGGQSANIELYKNDIISDYVYYANGQFNSLTGVFTGHIAPVIDNENTAVLRINLSNIKSAIFQQRLEGLSKILQCGLRNSYTNYADLAFYDLNNGSIEQSFNENMKGYLSVQLPERQPALADSFDETGNIWFIGIFGDIIQL